MSRETFRWLFPVVRLLVFREHMANLADGPTVLWAMKRLLVMEFIPGKRLDDLEYIDSNNICRDDVSASLARIFNEMIFGKDAPLHCDPHGGNLAIRVNNNRSKPLNFDIILYDTACTATFRRTSAATTQSSGLRSSTRTSLR